MAYRTVSKRHQIPSRAGKTIMEGFSLYPEDRRLLLEIMQRYGCSKSEAFRTVVRAHALQIGITSPAPADPPPDLSETLE